MLDPSAVRPDGTLVEEELKRLIIRRHRHSPDVAGTVGADWAERRQPRNVLVRASATENAVSAELDKVWLHPEGASPYSGANKGLFPWTLAKAFLSSPLALRETIANRLRGLDPDDVAQAKEVEALRRLDRLADAVGEDSAKYAALVKPLRTIGVAPGSTTRAVVFAERVATLKWLQRSLVRDLRLPAEAVRVLHGGLSDVEQQEIVESFKQSSSPIRVLVTGDLASEGVNLHSQCSQLIHYDIPWSLIRLEQRNGRIDRYGQKTPPQITALLLDPDSERFAGDVRVLSRLVEKEHEAHQALGDSASLMGKYDVAAEEEAIRKILAEGRDLDAEVKDPQQVKTGGGLTGLLAQFSGPAPAEPSTPPPATGGPFTNDLDFFRAALHEVFETPGLPPAADGVAWREFPQHSIVELEPPADLRQRLEVLPQSYLAGRRVNEKLKLATSVAQGRTELARAREDDSSTLWPEAHYLSPLHPVVDWAADRALAALGRNEVFAVRGDVDEVSVLLQGTLTNQRGQTVAASYLIARFPNPDNLTFAPVEPYGSASVALTALTFVGPQVNTGGIAGADRLTRYVAPAVRAADALLTSLVGAAETAADERVRRWSERTDRWEHEAGALVQRGELRDRRQRVEQERELAQAMRPDRRLVRPLLVVVPRDTPSDGSP